MTGRREHRKQATRAALSEAAMQLALEHGVENVTVEQISDAADVARRTFFNYFSTKEEAVVAGDSARGDVLVERFRSRPDSESVLSALRAAVLALFDDLTTGDKREELKMLRRSPSLLPHQLAAYATTERKLAVAIAERIGESTPEGEPPEERVVSLYPTLVAATTMAGARVAMQRWTDQTVRGSRDLKALHDVVGEVFARLTCGLDDR